MTLGIFLTYWPSLSVTRLECGPEGTNSDTSHKPSRVAQMLEYKAVACMYLYIHTVMNATILQLVAI